MLRRRVRGILDDPYDDFDAEENPVEYVKVPPPTLHTPRGTPIFVPPRSVDRSGFIDVLLAWRHKFPLEFALIVFFSFMSRFWRIENPGGVVFDESHFGGFVEHYLAGTYFFDIHPPLGKLTMALYGHMAGYKPGVCSYESNSMYTPQCQYALLRHPPAFFGSLLPPLAYGIAREVGGSRATATLSSLLVLTDVYNVMEARCILTDSQVIFYCALCLYVALRWWRRLNSGVPLPPWQRWCWILAVGLTCGASISVKWTGLASPGLIAVESFFAVWFLARPAPVRDCLIILAIGLMEYHMWWWFHFWALPLDGEESYSMPLSFQATLIGNEHYDPSASKPNFLYTMWHLNKDMLVSSASINTPHRWESKYYQWVLNLRGLLYYGEPFGPQPGLWSAMYLIGNPFIIWGCAIGIVAFLGSAALRVSAKCRRERQDPKVVTTHVVGSYLFLGWLLNLLPYLAVTRQAFAYHYIPGLFYAQILVPRWLQTALPPAVLPVAFKLIGLIAIVVFVFFMPWVYSLPLEPAGHEARRWLPGWD